MTGPKNAIVAEKAKPRRITIREIVDTVCARSLILVTLSARILFASAISSSEDTDRSQQA